MAFCRRPRRSTPPAPPAGSVPEAARRSGSQLGGARRRALWLVLDRRLRMGEDSASGVPWGDGLGTGDVGRLEGAYDGARLQDIAQMSAHPSPSTES